jgi:hypothetical protein
LPGQTANSVDESLEFQDAIRNVRDDGESVPDLTVQLANMFSAAVDLRHGDLDVSCWEVAILLLAGCVGGSTDGRS